MKECPYAEKCYRKNPIHFKEFSHAHLNEILSKGRNSSNEYDIPGNLSKELVSIQIRFLVKDEKTNTTTENGNKRGSSPNPTGALTSTQNADIDTSASCSNGSNSSNASNLAKKQKLNKDIRDYIPVIVNKGQMADKLAKAAPYNMFLTAITDSKKTHQEPLTITFQEIFDESLGEIESTVQINFMVDIGWLLGHYYFADILNKPLLVLYGDETPELLNISRHKKQVTAIKVNMPMAFATSHTKMMLLAYQDGSMRIVISTANLYEDDWHNRVQGIWISPKLKKLPEDADTSAGESPTGFKEDIILYLSQYKIDKLQPWITRIRQSDLSEINVFFIGSVPGGFRETDTTNRTGIKWGHARVSSILQKHVTPIEDRIPIVCQSSSIGSLGANIQTWIQTDFVNSLRKDSQTTGVRQMPQFKMIYPSFGNVTRSYDGLLGGGCLPYSKSTNDKQPWLKSYLYQWKSDDRNRTYSMPHIKSYTRFDLEQQSVYWFMLTSANLSKAAWGSYNKTVRIQPCLRIANYEAGVLFIPKFVTGEDTFPLCNSRNGVPAFPLPYDVPLTPYGPDDKPFLMDYLHDS